MEQMVRFRGVSGVLVITEDGIRKNCVKPRRVVGFFYILKMGLRRVASNLLFNNIKNKWHV